MDFKVKIENREFNSEIEAKGILALLPLPYIKSYVTLLVNRVIFFFYIEISNSRNSLFHLLHQLIKKMKFGFGQYERSKYLLIFFLM